MALPPEGDCLVGVESFKRWERPRLSHGVPTFHLELVLCLKTKALPVFPLIIAGTETQH